MKILTEIVDQPLGAKRFGRHEILPCQEKPLRWHKALLTWLFSYFGSNLRRALKSGAAHVMARKNSVFAHFEHITWDQWQFFVLNDAPNDKPKWHNPYWLREHRDWQISATGPGGERLYSIHIAPGVASVGEDSGSAGEQQKCIHWLLKLMRQFPDKRPLSREQLYQEAVRMFPGMSKRAFKTCVSVALTQEPNRKWRSAGRLRKSARESTQTK
jgi:hypothetical protein